MRAAYERRIASRAAKKLHLSTLCCGKSRFGVYLATNFDLQHH